MEEEIDFSLPSESTQIEKPKLMPKPKRRVYFFKDLGGNPDDRELTLEDRIREARWDRTKEDWKSLVGGISKTFGTAASGASLLYSGGWNALRLLNGNRSTSLGLKLAKYVNPSSKVDLGFDILQFSSDPSLSSGAELGIGEGLNKWKNVGNAYRLLTELGSQGLNIANSI